MSFDSICLTAITTGVTAQKITLTESKERNNRKNAMYQFGGKLF